MIEAVSNAFSNTTWFLGLLIYVLIGWILVRPNGGFWNKLASVFGWPVEVAQRISGATGLPYIFLLPNLLVFGLFTFAPMFINMGFSVTEGQSILFEERAWAGNDNLERLLSPVQIDTGGENREDDKFIAAVYDTATFVVFQVPIMVLIALITALALNRKVVARGLWRAVFFYPVMLSPVVVGFLWTLILKRQGLLTQYFLDWGIIDAPIQWLTDPSWTMFWSIVVYTWAHLGFYMLILLAGLQAIPRDVYEAAEMDSASPWRQLTRLTIPLLAPTILVVTVLALIKAFQAFEELYAMSVRWISLVGYIFDVSGLRGQPTTHGLGIAAMASFLVALLLIILSLLQIYISSKGKKA
jgi:alpha-1,4-digalacturonate transport system permease protein